MFMAEPIVVHRKLAVCLPRAGDSASEDLTSPNNKVEKVQDFTFDDNTSLEDTPVAPPVRFESAGAIRILVLDDDPLICRLITAALGHHKFTIDTVHEPALMESRLRSGPCHLIILDYLIPGVNFEQMLDSIAQSQPGASVVVVTAFPSLDSVLHCLRARIHDYLPKPFEMVGLEATVLRCLESKGLLRLSEAALRSAIGAAIRDRRKALKMRLAELAERTDLSVGYLSQVELGKCLPSLENVYRISLALRVRMVELFQGIQPRF